MSYLHVSVENLIEQIHANYKMHLLGFGSSKTPGLPTQLAAVAYAAGCRRSLFFLLSLR